MNVQTDGWKKFLQNMLLPSLRVIPRQKNTNILILPEFNSLPKTPFGNQHCFCDLSVQPGRLLYPATEKKNIPWITKCSFPSSWLGLEGEELSLVTGLKSAAFCHKGGFLMTCGTLEDSVLACRSSLAAFHEEAVIVSLGGIKKQTCYFKSFRIFLLPGSYICRFPNYRSWLWTESTENSPWKRQNGKAL